MKDNMPVITNLATKPDRIDIRYNAGRIIGYIYYGDICYRMLLIHVLDKNNNPINDTYKMTAINPSIY